MQLRALTRDDIPAWDALLTAIEQVDRTGEHYNEADLVEEMANPDLDLSRDLVGAFAGDDLVGYFCVYPRSAAEDLHKVALDGGVRPDARGRGVGRRLVTVMHARALEAHREQHPELAALLTLTGVEGNQEQAELLAEVGLRPTRWSFTMRVDMSRPTAPPPPVPEDLVLRTYEPLPHRMAVVSRAGGITWIDDSKATNVGAAVTSIGSVDGPLVLIGGGDGKGAGFESVAAALKG